MKVVMLLFLVGGLILSCRATEYEGVETKDGEDSSWWKNFKEKVKTVVTKWRDDLKTLWDEVLSKATDMRSWTEDMFESFKLRLKKWMETRPELPDEEKNEIETFISKLKLTTAKPETKSEIDP